MERLKQFYIGGAWTSPSESTKRDIISPSTERAVGTVAMGETLDVDRAVGSARAAFDGFASSSRDERLGLLSEIIRVYRSRAEELADAVTLEMGAPYGLARSDQVPAGLNQFVSTAEALRTFEFETRRGLTAVMHEPIGVCALITPWNWPLLLIGSKVAPALAAGCTMVLKPSEMAPISATLLAEILHEAGVPAGVFNLVHGEGMTVGAALSSHRDVDMVSITGSTRAGIQVARNAAWTVKRVHQELGGKSAAIVLPDVDLEVAIAGAVRAVLENSGQSCDTTSRILVQRLQLQRSLDIAVQTLDEVTVGNPQDVATTLGPVASMAQYHRIQELIERALGAGATLVAGGLGRPAGMTRGAFVRPTILANVSPAMEIAREEIFGPVLTFIAYEDEDHAVRIANDSLYGLSGAVWCDDLERARSVARRIRTGMYHINGKGLDGSSPFGGYKQSGNGREYGEYGLREFLEAKSIFGYYV
jgi:aldehyde dehydrogenase (NAD+)